MQYDCGSSSVLIVTNNGAAFPSGFSLNGYSATAMPTQAFNIPCKGLIEASSNSGVQFKIMPSVNPVVDFSLPFSFLAGLMCAFAFAVISLKRW